MNQDLQPVPCPTCGKPLKVNTAATPEYTAVPFTHVHFLCDKCETGGTYYQLYHLAQGRDGQVKPITDKVFLAEPTLFPEIMPWVLGADQVHAYFFFTGHPVLHVLKVLHLPVTVRNGPEERQMHWVGTVSDGGWQFVEVPDVAVP